jgi:hypothetical protein
VWVRSIRLECDTYSTINAGHFLSVWQVDDGEWRVTIEVAGQEIVIAHATTPQHGMRAANAWAAGHDSSLIKLRRAMRHGASTWILDEAALAASAVNTNQQGDPTP